MTKKQERFAIEYLVDANATQAAVRAGYSEKTAYSQGQRMLKNVEVQNYIQEHMKAIEDSKIATADEIIKYLTSVLRGETAGEEIVIEACGDGSSKAKAITKAPSEKDKLKAAELLGKRYGLFKDNMLLEVEPIVINNDLTE
jgi:phage terminase small subunit